MITSRSPELEKVTLFTAPAIRYPLARRTAEGLAQTLRSFVVVEIASAHTPLLRQTMYPSMEAKRYWDLELPVDTAKRFSDFYRRTLVRGTFPQYECHSLPNFLYGSEKGIQRSSKWQGQTAVAAPVPDCMMEAGKPYAIVDEALANTHSLLSLGDIHPGFSVSILEGNGPLVVSTNIETSTAFGGAEIRPLIYERAGKLAVPHAVT